MGCRGNKGVRIGHASHSAECERACETSFESKATDVFERTLGPARQDLSKVDSQMKEVIDTAVLLVAGIGSRLRPLTDEIPKALVKVGQSSILERAVATLRGCGICRFVFATGYREDAVRAASAAMGIDAEFCHNPQFSSTQNSISLLRCQSAVGQRGFFKLDGDVLFERSIVERLNSGDAELEVAVDGMRPLDLEAMKVVCKTGGVIERFGKSVGIAESQGESIGIERISAAAAGPLFDAIAELERRGVKDRYYEDVYSDLIAARRVAAHAVEVGDLNWTEVDDFADLQRATSAFT